MPSKDRTLAAGSLERMQNGMLGEARTRAFLANRFWVLERSVDVQGADFLIQINSLVTSVLDDHPPRFAIVQTKFVQAESTRISIPSSYLKRDDGSLSREFFLIICTGYGDDERMFLLDAEEIDDLFDTTTVDGGREARHKPASFFLRSTNYEITGARNHALNRIERSLRDATYSANRFWLTNLGYGAGNAPSLPDVYHYPVTGHDDLPDYFKDWKKAASRTLDEMEEVASYLQDGIAATWPSELEKATDELDSRTNFDGNLTFKSPPYMQDFYIAAKYQMNLVSHLRSKGLEGAWLRLAEQGQRVTTASLANVTNDYRAGLHFTIEYEPATLEVTKFQASPEDNFCATPAHLSFIEPRNTPGHVEICVRADVAAQVPQRPTYLSTLTDALSHAILPAVFGIDTLDDI